MYFSSFGNSWGAIYSYHWNTPLSTCTRRPTLCFFKVAVYTLHTPTTHLLMRLSYGAFYTFQQDYFSTLLQSKYSVQTKWHSHLCSCNSSFLHWKSNISNIPSTSFPVAVWNFFQRKKKVKSLTQIMQKYYSVLQWWKIWYIRNKQYAGWLLMYKNGAIWSCQIIVEYLSLNAIRITLFHFF